MFLNAIGTFPAVMISIGLVGSLICAVTLAIAARSFRED